MRLWAVQFMVQAGCLSGLGGFGWWLYRRSPGGVGGNATKSRIDGR